jgi:hypothetical protein
MPETDDFSVSSRREEKINAEGTAWKSGLVVWRLVWVINEQ